MMRVYKLARTIQVHLVRRRSNSLMFKETDKNGLVLFVTFSLNRSHRMAAVTVATYGEMIMANVLQLLHYNH